MGSTQHSTTRSLVAISPRLIVVSVAGCLILAGALVPQKEELVKRLIEDGKHERAIAVAADELPGMVPPLQVLPAMEVAQTPLEGLEALLSVGGAGVADEELAQRIHAADDAQACLELIHRVEAQLPPETRERLYAATAQSALAQGKPDLAADLLTDAAKRGIRSESLLAQQVQSLRWSGRPSMALEAMQAWETNAPLPKSLREQQIAVLRELNQPGKALDLIIADLQTTPEGTSYDADKLVLASEVAVQAGAMSKVLPLVDRFLSAMPAGKASLEELKSETVKPDATWFRFARLMAQQCEWSGHPKEAFALYQKLAVLGEEPALDRILALEAGLNRDGDLLAVLRHVVPHAKRPELTLKLARLMADAAEYEGAEQHFLAWLKNHPKDLAVMMERGAMLEEQSSYEAARLAYEQVLAVDPNHIQAQKELANMLIAKHQFREAFTFYEKLPEEEHDSFTLENYALIAESLAEYKAYNRALVLRMNRLKTPNAQDYLELARSYQVIRDNDSVVRVYQQGMARVPRSRILRIELANAYRTAERYDEAIALLARPELKSDMHAMQLYIEVVCLKEDYTAALAFLGRGFENRFAFGPETRLDLGHIYFNTGYLSDADALYSSVPDEPALWPLLANARFKAGNYASAEQYQRKYLAALKVPDPQGWMLMGDIYKATGRSAEAANAYATSLRLMEEKMTPEDESGNEPTFAPANSEPKSAFVQ
jgi:Flp pilus assembly protein TadD